MKELEKEGLRVVPRRIASSVTIAWFGTSDSRSPGEWLDPYLSALARELGEIGGLTCRVDLTKLEYMNSSSVGPLMRFVKELDQAEVTTKMVFSSAVEWQQTSSRAFKIVAMRLDKFSVEIEES